MKNGEVCWYNFEDGRRPAIVKKEQNNKYIIPLTSKIMPRAIKIEILGKIHSYFEQWKIIYNPMLVGEKIEIKE